LIAVAFKHIVVDEIERQDLERNEEHELDQLRELEEVETALKAIGVTLEPRFDISLTARIGSTSTKKIANDSQPSFFTYAIRNA
jgi:hypothetical protein